ncbi:hypothetical protein Hanom_Chr09g00761771 [Helianthus anomalus]
MAEKLKSKSAKEARKVSQAALDVAQDNYAEVRAIVEPLVANSILNSIELGRAVAALTVGSLHAGHCEGYVECMSHVETAFDVQWGTRHCLVNEQAEEGLCKAEENYDNLSLHAMDRVSEALKHDDYVMRLKMILEPPETLELTDDDDDDAGDGNAE